MTVKWFFGIRFRMSKPPSTKRQKAPKDYYRKTVVIPVALWNTFVSRRLKEDPEGPNLSRLFRNLCRDAMKENGQEEAC